jgi:type I restriction enzyme S subunit
MSKHKQYDVANSTKPVLSGVEMLNTSLAEERVGYKETQLGWIPEDWSVKSLDQLGEFSKGKGIAKKDILEDEVGGLPCVRYAEIYTIYHYNTTVLKSKINQESAANSNPINYGDILFAGSGETLEDIGKSIAYLNKETAYAGGDICILKYHNQDPRFLGYLFNNDVVRSQLFKIGQGHSVVHIYSSGLKKVTVPIPSLPEQQKIAIILNTWDKAINAQEKLIAQKQALKKGLMQQLLTGKKRFAGFVEEWEEIKLGDLLTIRNGKDYKHLETGEIPVYGTGGIMTYVNSFLYDGESVGIGRKGTIDKPVYLNGKFWTVDTLFYCNSFMNCIPKYIYYLFQTINWKRYNEASGVPSLSQATIKNIQVIMPTILEQAKIVETLSRLDENLNQLNEKKDNLKVQKQGLMQQLLTGEKRVKV